MLCQPGRNGRGSNGREGLHPIRDEVVVAIEARAVLDILGVNHRVAVAVGLNGRLKKNEKKENAEKGHGFFERH